MTYAKNRRLRKELALAFGQKGFQNDALDNQAIVLKIAQLRFKRAPLIRLSHPLPTLYWKNAWLKPLKPYEASWKTSCRKHCLPPKKSLKNWREFAKKLRSASIVWRNGIVPITPKKLKQERFNFDDEQLKPYFKLENVIDGAFEVAQKLFGLQRLLNLRRHRHLPQGCLDIYRGGFSTTTWWLFFMPIFSQELGNAMVHG